jgi:hypothetical protein
MGCVSAMEQIRIAQTARELGKLKKPQDKKLLGAGTNLKPCGPVGKLVGKGIARGQQKLREN